MSQLVSRHTSATVMLLAGILFSFSLIVMQWARASNQEDARESIDRIGEMAQILIDPIIELLRKKSQFDADLQEALGKIQLYVRPRFFGQGNAEASRRATRDLVLIDQGLVLEALAVSDLATLRMASNVDWGVIQQNVLEGYSNQVGAARIGGSTIPHFTFDESRYLANDFQREVSTRYSLQVSKSVFSWVVLHESAHHVKEHTSYVTEDYELEELQADQWAFSTMIRMGLPLWGVYDYLMLMHRLADVRVAHGVEAPVNASFWGRRANQLASKFDLSAQPDGTLVSFLGVVEWTDLGASSSSPKHIRLLFPSRCDDSRWYANVSSSIAGLKGLLACEEQGSRKILYGRAGAVTNKIVIDTPGKIDSVITFDIAANGELISRFSYNAIYVEHSLALSRSQAEAEASISLLNAVETDPVELATAPLKRMTIQPDTRNTAGTLIRSCVAEQGRLYKHYMMGVGDDAGYLRASQDQQIRCATQLQQTLGASNYRRYQQLIMEDPLVKYSVDQLTNKGTQK